MIKFNTPIKVRVLKVSDGDTIYCEDPETKKAFKVRLSEIDAPEMAQPAGWEAKYGLYKMLEETDFEVYLTPKSVGYRGRLVGVIFNDKASAQNNNISNSINARMCEEGLAWYYQMGKENNISFKNKVLDAKMRGVGLWSRKEFRFFKDDPIEPKIWRAENRKMTAVNRALEERLRKKFMKYHGITEEDLNKTLTPPKKENELNTHEIEGEEVVEGMPDVFAGAKTRREVQSTKKEAPINMEVDVLNRLNETRKNQNEKLLKRAMEKIENAEKAIGNIPEETFKTIAKELSNTKTPSNTAIDGLLEDFSVDGLLEDFSAECNGIISNNSNGETSDNVPMDYLTDYLTEGFGDSGNRENVDPNNSEPEFCDEYSEYSEYSEYDEMPSVKDFLDSIPFESIPSDSDYNHNNLGFGDNTRKTTNETQRKKTNNPRNN